MCNVSFFILSLVKLVKTDINVYIERIIHISKNVHTLFHSNQIL